MILIQQLYIWLQVSLLSSARELNWWTVAWQNVTYPLHLAKQFVRINIKLKCNAMQCIEVYNDGQTTYYVTSCTKAHSTCCTFTFFVIPTGMKYIPSRLAKSAAGIGEFGGLGIPSVSTMLKWGTLPLAPFDLVNWTSCIIYEVGSQQALTWLL